MKKTIGLLAGLLIALAPVIAGNAPNEKMKYIVDTDESKVFWTGKKVGGEHTGYLSVHSGSIEMNQNTLTDAEVKMDMNSIVCTDLEAGEWNDRLVGHLKSDDFFSVEKHASSHFDITSVKKLNGTNSYEVKGNLTIKGITNEISFPARIDVNNGMVNATGTAKLDRTEWDIKYRSGRFFAGLGDKMIHDDFEITFDIKAKPDAGGTSMK